MRVAIAGAGMSGSYMYRLLKNSGFNVTIFDQPHATMCGIAPCAWGVSNGFDALIADAGLNPGEYVVHQFDSIYFDGDVIPINIMTINKPRLINDLLGGADVKYKLNLTTSDYDLIIDATGVDRQYLPEIPGDLIALTFQCRIKRNNQDESHQKIIPKVKLGSVGYCWDFPLHNNYHHIGAASLKVNPFTFCQAWSHINFKWNVREDTICHCNSRIRVTGVERSQPYIAKISDTTVVGIGESIGCVSPLAGDGIVPSMVSAKILLNNIHNIHNNNKYAHEIVKAFSWIEPERKILDKFISNKKVNIFDAWTLRNNIKRMGGKVGLLQALSLLKRWC